jgi:nitroreductase
MTTTLDPATCDKLLTTTRSVRLRLDLARPVPPVLIRECLEVALQAPSETNTQRWRFIVITAPDKRAALARIYRDSFHVYWEEAQHGSAGTPAAVSAPVRRMIDSAVFLTEHLHEVPVHVLFCIEGDLVDLPLFEQASAYGSIMPAVWSFMLAARARGLGCCWTSVHLKRWEDAAQVLGIPAGVTQCALLPVAYYTGTNFREAPRNPLSDVLYWDTWGCTEA